jgi:hypothetical protein
MSKRERPIPYERRARLPGAGIVDPHDEPPVGAKRWPKWSLPEARRQGQQELFPDHRSTDPDLDIVRQLRRKRRKGCSDE